MDPTFPYAGHEQSPLWWALALLVVALTVVGLMALFLARATRESTPSPGTTAPSRGPGTTTAEPSASAHR